LFSRVNLPKNDNKERMASGEEAKKEEQKKKRAKKSLRKMKL